MILVSSFVSSLLLASPGDPPSLSGDAEVYAPFLGTWEVEARWAWGATLSARATYEPGIGGRFVEVRTFVSDNGGDVYQRYFVLLGHDEDGGEVAHTFKSDGSYSASSISVEDGVLISEWMDGGSKIHDQLASIDADTQQWTVKMQPEGSDSWQTIMDATWRRVPDGVDSDATPSAPDRDRAPIPSWLFEGRGVDVRSFRKAAIIAAPLAEVYAAWSDQDAFVRSYRPDRDALAANIDLAIGGRYEWLFDGENGSNGCQVLSYVPNRMISFSWNAPPSQGESRGKHTWVVVEFEPLTAGETEVTITHLGFGAAAHWDETFAYFTKAWEVVLGNFKTHLERAAG